MPQPQLTSNQAELLAQLEVCDEAMRKSSPGCPPGLKPNELSLYSFVLKHGRFWPLPDHPPKIKRGRSKECFANAQELALKKGWTFVEGFAWSDFGAIHHAWCLNDEGAVVDATWRESAALYFGVPFVKEYLLQQHAVQVQSGLIGPFIDGTLLRMPEFASIVAKELAVD